MNGGYCGSSSVSCPAVSPVGSSSSAKASPAPAPPVCGERLDQGRQLGDLGLEVFAVLEHADWHVELRGLA
ncbi:hypothetical protein ACPCSK_14240 [Streptomyces griseoincarnatus]